MICHHPKEDLLLSYSSGSLGEGWSLAVATHLSYCPSCRIDVEYADEIGGVFLDEQKPDTLSAGSFENLLEKIKVPKTLESSASETYNVKVKPEIPQPLRNYLGGNLNSIAWKSIGGGAKQYHIPTSGESKARLLNIPAGKPVPEHSHGGRELTLVLLGGFSDDDDYYGPGDIQDVDDTITHQPVAGMKEACICLAVTDAPLRFSALAPRLFQPLIGI